MRHPVVYCLALVVMTVAASSIVLAQQSPPQGSPVYSVTLPEGYRNWKLITVAHEAGMNNDIRAILGNEIALKAFQDRTRPFPDGTIIARVAWEYQPSAANDAVFPAPQSFVAGPPTNVQISVKDLQRYAATGGWGYGQFEDNKPNPSVSLMHACFACHSKVASSDLVFSHYSP